MSLDIQLDEPEKLAIDSDEDAVQRKDELREATYLLRLLQNQLQDKAKDSKRRYAAFWEVAEGLKVFCGEDGRVKIPGLSALGHEMIAVCEGAYGDYVKSLEQQRRRAHALLPQVAEVHQQLVIIETSLAEWGAERVLTKLGLK